MKQTNLIGKFLTLTLFFHWPLPALAEKVICNLSSTPIDSVDVNRNINYENIDKIFSLEMSAAEPSKSDSISFRDSKGAFTLINIDASIDSNATVKNISVSVVRKSSLSEDHALNNSQTPTESEHENEVTVKFQTADHYYRVLCLRTN